MYVCMYVCMYEYVHNQILEGGSLMADPLELLGELMYVCMHACMHVCIHLMEYMYAHICMPSAYGHLCLFSAVCVCARAHTHTFPKYTNTHMYLFAFGLCTVHSDPCGRACDHRNVFFYPVTCIPFFLLHIHPLLRLFCTLSSGDKGVSYYQGTSSLSGRMTSTSLENIPSEYRVFLAFIRRRTSLSTTICF
jgi:hypothetical protein